MSTPRKNARDERWILSSPYYTPPSAIHTRCPKRPLSPTPLPRSLPAIKAPASKKVKLKRITPPSSLSKPEAKMTLEHLPSLKVSVIEDQETKQSKNTVQETAFAIPGTSCELVSLSLKGFGIRAKEPIHPGEIIFRERPLLTFPASFDPEVIHSRLKALSKWDQIRVWTFSKRSVGDDDLVDIAQTNGIPLLDNEDEEEGSSGPDKMGLFESVSRVNHSCAPNSVWHWDRKTEHLVLKAWRTIEKGEEVTASYLDKEEMLYPTARRNKLLKLHFHIDSPPSPSDIAEPVCACSVCSRSSSEVAASDNLLKRYRDLSYSWTRQTLSEAAEGEESDEEFSARWDTWVAYLPTKALRDLQEAREIALGEQKLEEMGHLWHEEAMVRIVWGHKVEAIHAAERAMKWFGISKGLVAAQEWYGDMMISPETQPEWRRIADEYAGVDDEDDSAFDPSSCDD